MDTTSVANVAVSTRIWPIETSANAAKRVLPHQQRHRSRHQPNAKPSLKRLRSTINRSSHVCTRHLHAPSHHSPLRTHLLSLLRHRQDLVDHSPIAVWMDERLAEEIGDETPGFLQMENILEQIRSDAREHFGDKEMDAFVQAKTTLRSLAMATHLAASLVITMGKKKARRS